LIFFEDRFRRGSKRAVVKKYNRGVKQEVLFE